ncbi:hypothetical protein ZIOFF_030715 [Zingiber officinale]|uniref:UBC core domain-containing protein n=1 Tax=Zingiber officinale TaxID=94328 RepID=A0A8J5L553_ZINOF|nr:hypothetical protein ZIOFF_030715 [Zingiber officinale]
MPFAFPHQILDLGGLPSRLVVFELAFSVYEVFLLLFYFRMLRSFGEVCVLKQIVRMSTSARKRLMRDFKRLQQDPPAGISGAPHDNNIMLWNAVIFGPDDTPWDGGLPIREAA